MKSFDDIKLILEAELDAAMTAHENRSVHWHHTGEAVALAIERYQRFVHHGMIPEDLVEDEHDG